MSLYSQMHSIAGASSSSQADEPVQRELQSLLWQLNWSYVALWTLNHQTSRLEWRAGHFRVKSTAITPQGDTEVWNEHLFNSAYKSCTFASGQGSVGTAYTENRNIWMNGSSVRHSAGSKEQAEFLQQAGIETSVCVTWAESVLELGTSKIVAENLDLTADIRIYLSERILPSLAALRTMAQSGPFPPLNLTRRLSDKFLDQDFELNSLNNQMRISSSLSSLNTDMFLQSEEQPQAGKDLDSSIDPRWIPASGATQAPLIPLPNQAMRVQHSNTTSSSVSFSEDGSVRLSPRNTPAHSPENPQNNISDTISVQIQVEDEIQQAISHMLEEEDHTHWRNMYINQEEPASNFVNVLPTCREPAFKEWRHPHSPVAPAVNRPNQALLRRCIQILKQIPNLQQGSSSQEPADVQSLPGARRKSSSVSPEVELPDIGFEDDPFDQPAPRREQRRPKAPKTGTTGPMNPTHDEAALSHMMNERRRRIKQKEYFSALRKLVPIISKADKASTLGDAIMYIKDLQENISNLEASRAQTEARYENLRKTSEELELRNKELEAMVAGTESTSSHVTKRLHSSSRSF